MRTLTFLVLTTLLVRADDPVDRLAHDALKAWHVPGVAIAIVQDDKHIIAACGERAAGQPLESTDLFPLASCTKAFTATLIAKLVDEGRMTWDDPVRRHLPEFHLSDPKADALVSLRDLLTHRTGVNGHDLLWYRAPWKNDDVLKRIGKLPLSDTFRGSYQYSTLMYMAAGQAAANAGGKPWEALLQEKLIEPLGMTSVRYTTRDPDFLKAAKAEGHTPEVLGPLARMPRYEMEEPNAAGSLQLSIRDMVPWLQLQLGDGRRIVSKTNLEITHTPQVVIPFDAATKRFMPEATQLSYGMGWIISDYRGVKVLSHGGLIDGFRTQVILVPERKLGIALFSNRHGSRISTALGNSLVDHCLGLPAKDWNTILLKAVADEQAEREANWKKLLDAKKTLAAASLSEERYAGEYEHPAYGTAKIEWKDGKLIWSWSSFTTPLEYWGDDAFRFKEGFLVDQSVEFRTGRERAEALRFQGLIFNRR